MKSNISLEQKEQIKRAAERKKKLRPKRKKIWSVSDIDASKEYVLVLHESEMGTREFELKEFSDCVSACKMDYCVYITEKIPHDLLISRDLENIASAVKLQDGRKFVFSSNGDWMTQDEYEEFIKSIESAD